MKPYLILFFVSLISALFFASFSERRHAVDEKFLEYCMDLEEPTWECWWTITRGRFSVGFCVISSIMAVLFGGDMLLEWYGK